MTYTGRNPEARACSREFGPDCRYIDTSKSLWECSHVKCAVKYQTTYFEKRGCQYYEPKPPRTLGIVAAIIGSLFALSILISIGASL